MYVTKLSSKGQMVVPKIVRDALDLPAGAELTVEVADGGFLVKRRPRDMLPRTTVDQVAGMLKSDRRISDEEIEAAIEAELHARWRRKR